MNYYAKMNRYRGTKSKSGGCLLMALPALLIVGASGGYMGFTTGEWILQSYLLLCTLISPFICLMWVHNSDHWRYPEKMKSQWRLKGALAFGLLLNPLGYKLEKLYSSYAEHFDRDTGWGDKEQVEYEEGRQWGKQSLLTAVWNAILIILYINLLST